eukprot:5180159-Prymnesium_polylepis.3
MNMNQSSHTEDAALAIVRNHGGRAWVEAWVEHAVSSHELVATTIAAERCEAPLDALRAIARAPVSWEQHQCLERGTRVRAVCGRWASIAHVGPVHLLRVEAHLADTCLLAGQSRHFELPTTALYVARPQGLQLTPLKISKPTSQTQAVEPSSAVDALNPAKQTQSDAIVEESLTVVENSGQGLHPVANT